MWGLLRQVRWVSLLKISYINSMHFKNLLPFCWLGCCFQQNHEEPSRPPAKRHWSKAWVQVRDEWIYEQPLGSYLKWVSGRPKSVILQTIADLFFLFIWNKKIKLCNSYFSAAVVLIFISFSFVLVHKVDSTGCKSANVLGVGMEIFLMPFLISALNKIKLLVLDILHRNCDVC